MKRYLFEIIFGTTSNAHSRFCTSFCFHNSDIIIEHEITRFSFNTNYCSQQDIGLSPARLILHSADQLQLYGKLAKSGSLILHIDATAGIIKRAEYVRKQVYVLSAVVDSPFNEIEAFSVSDCLTEECRVEDTEFWLRKLRCDVARQLGVRMDTTESAPAVVVVDFSWVLLHSCLAAFCGTTALPYLKEVFHSSMGESTEGTCRVFSCTSHFMSRAARALSAHFTKDERPARQLMLHCIAGMVSAPNLASALELWKLMNNVFGRPPTDTRWKDDFSQLLDLLQMAPKPAGEDPDTDHQDRTPGVDEMSTGTIRERSPYSKYFPGPETNDKLHSEGPFYKPQSLAYIHKVWLPLYGFWGQPALIGVRNVTRYLTNAKIEAWFG